jgi:hypothetical protein
MIYNQQDYRVGRGRDPEAHIFRSIGWSILILFNDFFLTNTFSQVFKMVQDHNMTCTKLLFLQETQPYHYIYQHLLDRGLH